MPNNAQKQLLTINEVAEALNVSTSTIWRQVKGGGLPEPIKIGTLTRWKRSEIEAIYQPVE